MGVRSLCQKIEKNGEKYACCPGVFIAHLGSLLSHRSVKRVVGLQIVFRDRDP